MVAEAWERVRVAPDKAAGCDEAGRGPLAGNVIAAAVILDHRNLIEGLADSKKLSQKKEKRFTRAFLATRSPLAWAARRHKKLMKSIFCRQAFSP